MRIVRPLLWSCALFVAAPGVASVQESLPGHESLAPRAETFVEVPGQLEFSGVMIARPLQERHAERYGLSAEEARNRGLAAGRALLRYDVVDYVPETDESLIRVAPGSEQAVAAELMSTGDFQYVEPDWRVYPIVCSDDSLLGQQWHHNANRMNSCSGWDFETGDPNVVVAICDTGVRTSHVDLQLNRHEGYNAVNQLWENQGGAINDVNGHGTRTTGCAAANGDNGTGVSGTGWNLGHRMMRVSNSSDGTSNISVLTHAARTAADVGDKVASVSYSGVTASAVETAGEYVRDRGALLVWAAGNDSQQLNGGRNDNVIVVGSTTSSDAKSGFSNYGPYVDLMAPGSSILSTNSGGGYSSASGTSFACPLAAGLVGLIYSMDPNMPPAKVEQILRAGCDDLGAAGEDDTFGFGRIDVANTLALVPAGALLFFDDFEGGDFASGNWVTRNNLPKVKKISNRTGSWGAAVPKKTWIERSVDTTGFESIELRYSRRVRRMDAGEFLTVRWWDGVSWHTVETTEDAEWGDVRFTLPAGATNNPAFKVRFKSKANEGKERADIDDMCVLGTPQ